MNPGYVPGLRIIVHDFSGHPFQAQLARSLASRNHEVLHVRCTSYISGKGSFKDAGASSVQFVGLSLGEVFDRYHVLRRIRQELRYGRLFNAVATRFRPDVVISCNDPLLSKATFAFWAARRRVPWVFWLQDVYSLAMAREAATRSAAGSLIGAGFQALERRLLRSSDAVVAITDDFGGLLDEWQIAQQKRTVIENWAPLAEVPMRPRENPWRFAAGLDGRFTYLYAGTLGLKHNPDILHALAHAEPDADVVVVSEGLGAERLRDRSEEQPLANLRLLGFQPWEQLPDMLGAADVIVVLLEPEAGSFSVPSKILTALCAGRPILAAMPHTNLGARVIVGAGAGIVVPPGDTDQFLAEARRLQDDQSLRIQMGERARAYAERAFDIETVTDQFTEVLERARKWRP